MKMNFDGEEINLHYYTPIDNKEKKELDELETKWHQELETASKSYNIAIAFCFVVALITSFFVAITLIFALFALPCLLLIAIVIIVVVRNNKTAHLRNKLAYLDTLKETAILNDRIRHEEKIRYVEKENLKERDKMKQEEIKTNIKEKKVLPPRK